MTRTHLTRLLVLSTAYLAWPMPPAAAQPPAGVTFSYDLFVQGSQTPSSGSLSYTPDRP